MDPNQTFQPDTARLSPGFFGRNRAALLDRLEENCVVLLFSGLAPNRTADEDYPFFSNRNFFYFTGIEQEESTLLIRKMNGEVQTELFIRQRDDLAERWTGRRLRLEEAAAISGIENVHFLNGEKEHINASLLQPGIRLYIDLKAKDNQAVDFRCGAAKQWPSAEIHDITPYITPLRMLKSPEEIELIRQAALLTQAGLEGIMRTARAGAWEYEAWAAFQYALARRNCLVPAFPSIIAAGENSLCLHYMTPNDQIKENDVVQVDVGAIFGGLAADISRVYPASGKFTARQKSLYEVVRECQETVFAVIQPGIQIQEINEACKQTAYKGLVRIGALAEGEDVTKCYWHNVSHHLGHDVHDPVSREIPLEPNMVLTVEPGLYVPEWGFGIRLEDDVLVTSGRCELLSPTIPREIEEVEELTQRLRAIPAGY
jgi:Xaa-Pro aminopeptidase